MTRTLLLRIASALVLAPAAIAAAWAGGWAFAILVAVFAVGMAWEWSRLCSRGGPIERRGAAIILTIAAATGAAAAGAFVPAMVALAAGTAVVVAVQQRTAAPWLPATGTAYIGLAMIAVLVLRGPAAAAPWPVFWLFAVIWSTDIAAYAAGRTFGGPRLAPALSPRKTWSGLIGGAGAAAIAGGLVAWLLGSPSPGLAAALGGALAVVSQAGDLAESAAKRYFGVKDASGLIPGHGGMLDRLDGFMAAVLALVALELLVGEDVLGWQ
ncbi:MAG: phosphatidate cytidylyltransferase [Alphaproteobacteria bacterium]|nr:phosphatidate cytidylyltransferase [Alphaproteobacteria bacterium]